MFWSYNIRSNGAFLIKELYGDFSWIENDQCRERERERENE